METIWVAIVFVLSAIILAIWFFKISMSSYDKFTSILICMLVAYLLGLLCTLPQPTNIEGFAMLATNTFFASMFSAIIAMIAYELFLRLHWPPIKWKAITMLAVSGILFFFLTALICEGKISNLPWMLSLLFGSIVSYLLGTEWQDRETNSKM